MLFRSILTNLDKGQVLEGVIKNMTNFGVFIDLGGVDGLLHITDISWGRINHPQEVLKLDQKIQVVVFGSFLILIFGARFMVEFVKMGQTARDEYLFLNTGQLLSIPLVIAGIYLFWRGLTKKTSTAEL